MNKFIYALNEQTKEKLISLGYHLLQEQISNNKKMYVFENKNGVDISLGDFNKSDYIPSNTLFF